MRMPRLPGLAAFMLPALLPTFAAAQSFDVKTGLWENTITMDMGGAMPQMDLSGLPPAQRAQMEAMMKKSQHQVRQSCVTAEQLQRGMPASEKDCTYTYTARSASKVAGTVACKSAQGTSRGDFVFEAKSRELSSGTMNIVAAGAPGPSKMTFSSRWLGSDCGSVKPVN